MAMLHSHIYIPQTKQLSLFDFNPLAPSPAKPYIVTVTRLSPAVSAEKSVPVQTETSLPVWQSTLAVPVLVLAAAWSSLSGELSKTHAKTCADAIAVVEVTAY